MTVFDVRMWLVICVGKDWALAVKLSIIRFPGMYKATDQVSSLGFISSFSSLYRLQ